MKKLLWFLLFFPVYLYAKEMEYDTIQHGPLKYVIKSPADWVSSQEFEEDGGKYIFFKKEEIDDDTVRIVKIFPFSYEIENEDFPSIFIHSISKKTVNCSNYDEYFKYFNKKYLDEMVPIYDEILPQKIENKNKIKLHSFSGINKVFYVSIGILEENDCFISFGFVTKTNGLF